MNKCLAAKEYDKYVEKNRKETMKLEKKAKTERTHFYKHNQSLTN